ncbi:MAG: efflux RND transporter permease subunit [Deltaproteobacteria bacterium]|nr:efflux RND transporter permease subunit [Deltaproteobacteria bacterium]
MSLSSVSIARPVFATVCSLIIVLLGGVSFFLLGVREYPAVDPPVITVRANYAGASPSVIAAQITEPLEQLLNGIDGVRVLSSTSMEERSEIRVEFEVGSDLEAAANDVRDKVSQAARTLPADADPPVVEKSDADTEPIVFVAVQSASRSILEVNDFADRVIRERIQTIPGVATVRIWGEKRYAMRIWLDPMRLAAHGLTPLDVQRALEAQNVDLPSGRLEGTATELSLRTAGRLTKPEDFEAMILKEEGGSQVLLRDVGRAELGPENPRTSMRDDHGPLVGLAVIPQPNTDAVAIADEFYRRLEEIRRDMPPDYEIEVGYDFTTLVRRSIGEVQETMLIAFGLVAMIIFLFLRSWRSTAIPVVAIPVSIVSAFFVLYLGGFTLNVLTLVGLVLAIGLVCDDAIVVLENIYSKIERGRPPLEAALEGSKEIYFAVVSTTITLAVVFIPVFFMQGLTGQLFQELGVVVVTSVLVSAFVALSLSPMMCRFLLTGHDERGPLYHRTEPYFRAMVERYRRSLEAFLRIRWVSVPIILASAASIVVCLGFLPAELAPLEDRANIRVNALAPEGASVEFMEDQLARISTYLRDEVPEISRAFGVVGSRSGTPSTGRFNIYLKDIEDRDRGQEAVYQQLAEDFSQFTGVRAMPSQPPTIGDRRAGQPVQYVLQAPTQEKLVAILPAFLDAANASPVLRFVDVDLKINRPEGSIQIDRRRAAELGVSVYDIARTLQLAYGGQRFGYFLQNDRLYQVIGQVERYDRNDPGDLAALSVRSGSGSMISLDNLVRFEESVGPAAIYRFNRFPSATISAGLTPGHAVGDGIAALDEIADEILPEEIRTSLAGQSRDFADASASLIFAFAFALVLIYLVLAAQFESFRDPVIILMTVPLSLSGALLTLVLFGQTLNVFSQIGMILLIGLVTKNGILIVEFANQRRETGLGALEAVVEASTERLRPILMTALATALGALPIALALGGASGSRRSLGIAVVGGLVFSTLLTLYVVPAVYVYLSTARVHEPIAETAPEAAAAPAPGEGIRVRG